MASNVVWDPSAGTFVIAGAAVPGVVTSGAASAAANLAGGNMSSLALQLNQGSISMAAWEAAMQVEIINVNASAFALAHGGFNNMTQVDWDRCADVISKQLAFFDDFAADTAAGRYGMPPGSGMTQRASMYANNARSAYQNESARVDAATTGADEGLRILGAVDHCEDCVEWAGFDWMPLDDLLSDYAIGMSRCGNRCNCSIITRKAPPI